MKALLPALLLISMTAIAGLPTYCPGWSCAPWQAVPWRSRAAALARRCGT